MLTLTQSTMKDSDKTASERATAAGRAASEATKEQYHGAAKEWNKP